MGDVFTVPLDDERTGFGQVVAKYLNEGYYFAIFDRAYPRAAIPSLDAVVGDRVAFLALSLDAKIAAGHWEVVGREAVPARLPLPAYKESVGTPDRVDVVDYSGQLRRPARAEEVAMLPNRKIVAPVRLEKALRAQHRLELWQDAYDELRPSEIITTDSMFS